VLRDGPWASRPWPVDRTPARRPTPEEFRKAVPGATVEVIPLAAKPDAEHRPGWCTYSDAFDSPETEVLCGGINHKTPTAASVWRQGNLLHFGFDLSPDEMSDAGRALLGDCVVYVAGFADDRPLTRAPERALLRTRADKIAGAETPEKDYVEWYFTPEVRTEGKAADWPAFREWYKRHRDYLRADPDHKGSLVLDREAESFGTPPAGREFIPTAVAALKTDGPKAESAAKLLRRYAPDGPKEMTPAAWQAWWDENGPYLFFSESGWYRWYLDPLAKKRGVPAAELRGAARATRPDAPAKGRP
jgi:hypothetical protein